MASEKEEVDAGKQIEEWKRGERDFPISRVPPRKGADKPKKAPPRKEPPRERSESRGPASLKGSHEREKERRRRGEPTPRGITTTETLKKRGG